MIDNRTAEILAAIQNAARCTSDLSALLETRKVPVADPQAAGAMAAESN